MEIDLTQLADEKPEEVEREYSKEQTEILRNNYERIKAKVESGEEMTLEEQRQVIEFCRADRESKFILVMAKAAKAKKEKVVKEPKEKAPKKLTKKAYGALMLKYFNGIELTEEEKTQISIYEEGRK